MNRIEQNILNALGRVRCDNANAQGLSDSEILSSWQLECVNEMIDYVRSHSAFYAERLAGVGSLDSLDGLSSVPFTTPEDLRAESYGLLCSSQTKVARTFTHYTTGTLGRPKRVFFSGADALDIVDTMAGIIAEVFESEGHDANGKTVGVYLPDNGRLSMAELICQAATRLGCVPYKGSCMDEVADQIAEVEREKPFMIMGSAFRIWRMTQVGRDLCDLSKLGVKLIFVTSEYLSDTMRRRLEHVWGARVFHHYGMTEPGFAIGIECECHDGFHYDASKMLFEVVDPETGEPLPEGEVGELVYTSLKREAMPLIRYRTGDIASILPGRCACGALLSPRIGKMPQKLGMIHRLSTGESLYASLCDEALYEVDDLVDYRLFIGMREDGIETIECRTERIGNADDYRARVAEALGSIGPIRNAIDAGALVVLPVVVVERGELRRGGRTLKRKIEDVRDGGLDNEE